MSKAKSSSDEKVALYNEALALAKQKKVEHELPHLFSYKPYKWTVDYWESTNRMKFLCAANQASKSSSQIRHAIDLGTDPEKWPKFFPRRTPRTFWYIYPDGHTVEEEFSQKWEPEFLPRGSMKTHPQYGWKKLYFRSQLIGLQFNTGVTLYFKTWRMDFQSNTIDAIFVDEELPFDKFDEAIQRINMVDGLFSMVFTATLGQREWFETMMLVGKKGERFPQAFKRVISLEHDCRYYADGSPSPFDEEEVNRRKAKCSSQREIDRRIHGLFVSDEGLMFPSFERSRNVKPSSSIDPLWYFYGGVDIGTGGREGHPAAISIVAVKRDFSYGRLVHFWRGNKYETTNTSQILNRYLAMTKELNMTANYYDWHSKEFFLRSQEAGVPFIKADKSRDFGVDIMNTLFKNEMLDIDQGEYTDELVFELEHLKVGKAKTHAEDDGADSLRYAISSIPWDFSRITFKTEEEKKDDESTKKRITRHKNLDDDKQHNEWSYEDEIDEYEELLGGFY